ncbi:MAG: GNAT family N-acetyltransferase [Patescibacteria group bacterium]
MRVISFPDMPGIDPWHTLAHQLKSESAILATRITPESLRATYEQGCAVLLMNGSEEPIGFLAAWPVNCSHTEIGSAWVQPEYRDRKLSNLLYNRLRELPAVQERTIFGITKNVRSVKAGYLAQLKLHDNWQDPVPWELTCGPCDAFKTDAEKRLCPWRNWTCWLRVRN